MRSLPKLIAVIFSATVITASLLVYGFFQSRDYLRGPAIVITHPQEGSTIFGPSVEIRGAVKRANYLSLNDSQILSDPSGSFKEKLILPNGYNIMKFVVKDRFGKQTEKLLEFMVTSTPKQQGSNL